MKTKELESGIEYHHGVCEITYKKKGNTVFLQVNDLVIYDNLPATCPDMFEFRDLDSGLEKAYDILVSTPQIITANDYPKLFEEKSIPNAKLPSFELLRALGIKKINTPCAIDFSKNVKDFGRELIVKSRLYPNYEDVKWIDYEMVYTITHRYDGYKVRGILKSDLLG